MYGLLCGAAAESIFLSTRKVADHPSAPIRSGVGVQQFWILLCRSIAPQDAAVDKRVLYIRPTTSFMTTPTELHHRKADPRVKGMFKMECYKLAVVHLLMRAYRALPDAVKDLDDDIAVPPSVAAETKEQTETGGFLSLLEDGGFEITHDPNDYVRCAEVCDYMARHGMSKQRVGREMKKHTKVEGGKVGGAKVYHGIRRDGNLLR